MLPFKAAVVGLGQIGLTYDFDSKRTRPSSHVLAYQLSPEIELLAATDPRQEQGKLLHEIAGQARFYSSLDELLTEKFPLDIVSLCNPPAFHLSDIRKIVDNSQVKVIFCEKPLVSNLQEAQELLAVLAGSKALLIPNISRRWSRALREVAGRIKDSEFGELQKIHVRYTRGIFNTGAHLFDLLHWWAGKIDSVQVLEKVSTSADVDGDPSFTFVFTSEDGVQGFAEAFDDRQYWLFEMDFYFSAGKIEFRNSGNEIICYEIKEHQLFSGFNGLSPSSSYKDVFADSCLTNALNNIVDVLKGVEQPACNVGDAVYALIVAETLLKSYKNGGTVERTESL